MRNYPSSDGMPSTASGTTPLIVPLVVELTADSPISPTTKTDANMAKHQVISIYGCGGAGTNIARIFQTQPESVTGARVAYLDTSLSNLNRENEELAYLIEGVDGSGKKRDLNADSMRKNVSPALTKFPPGDFNIVIFSASGGTGSVFGPLIINSLLERGKPVVAAIIGDVDSAIAVKNTIKTLQTLSALSAKHETSIAVIYSEMAHGAPRRDVDEVIIKGIKALQQLASGMNAEMDTQDLLHWLHFDRVTDHPPALAMLNIYNSNEHIAELNGALSVASLYSNPDEPIGTVNTAYRITGYTNVPGTGPLHFVLTQEGLQSQVEKLERKQSEHHGHTASLAKNHVRLHDARDNSDDFLKL